ncbi:MAG TPA: PKD domain-containing protein, partial [Cyclobacteriaceae bacterium]|nr:PKD domain-containing protein [Cyclobacteriaceae bacterium]
MSNSSMLRWIVLFLCLLAAVDGFSQQNYSRYNWYFGNTNRGIRFSRSTAQPSLVNNKVIPFGTGGSAVATNPINGDLLFYTDGSRVFDITHTQMPNGGGLTVQANANQPVAISGKPGSPNQYYIFTNTASFTTGGTIRVTTVNMSASGNEIFPEPPIGNVTTKNQLTGLTGRSEAMITVPHANGVDYWLITHENGQDNFTATLIDASGSFATSTLSPNVTGFPMSAANFSYHEATGKLAVSPQTDSRNVAILNFNNATGAITLDRLVLNSGVNSTTSQAIYDTEWSPTGRFLYISVHGEPGITANVVQFDMNAPAGTSLVSVLDIPVAQSYGLMIAPDTSIYHLYQATAGGSFLLGRLTDLDSVGIAVTHTTDAFGGAINFNGRQFPEFLPRSNNNLAVSFVSRGTCSNSPVSFFPTVTPAADSLVWDFGDGNTSSEWSPVHSYNNGGAFNVSVTAFLNGQTAIGNGTVNLTNFTLQLTMTQDTTACKCEFPPPVGQSCNSGPFKVTVKSTGGTAPLTFVWSNGDTGATLTPDSAGYYYVVVTDATGCSTYAGVNIREYDAVDQRANIWYFGQNAGIDFNKQPPVPITGPLNTPEGCSVICDRNGEVIFSTDGVRVYDKNDIEITTTLVGGVPTPIPIPPGIGGEQGSTQSALIMPVQGDETIFYIFTTQQVHGSNTYELRYSLYDLKLNNGNGGLIEYNKLLFTRSTERITGNGQWMIAHEYGNNSFRAYPISTTGIGNPVISSLGSDHLLTEELNGQGYMELTGNLLAVALSTSPSNNALEIFDFVDTTGVVTNFRSLNLNTTSGQVYGVEIAGNKILTTIKGTPNSFLREAYIDFQNNPVLIPPGPASGPIAGELGAIQRGPDGTIYVAVNGATSLATVNFNPDTLQLSSVTLGAFPLAGGTQSRLGLPNFVQQIFNGTPEPSMTITAFCGGTPTIFQGVGTDQIDEFLWTFGDGFTADSANVEHTYPIPPPGTTQDYNVTLRITNRCGLDVLLKQTITISGPPPNPTFLPPGQQPTICNGPLTLQALPANDPTLTYLWSTGETTYSINVNRPQIVSLTITNAAGCTSNRNLLIADNRPIVELGPNQNICQNTPVSPLDAQNPGSNYAWAINEVPSGTTQTQSVSTAAVGAFEYRVQVTDPVTTCTVKDSVVFTINASPSFTAVPNTIVCGTSTGQIQLTITGPATGTFTYSVDGLTSGISRSNIDQTTGPVVPSPITGLVVDTYVIQVSDQISGCATTTSVGINSTSLTITNLVAQTPTCDPVALEFDASVASGTYRVINSTTGAVVVPVTAFASTHVITPPVAVPGDYIVEIRQGACVSTAPISVVSDPKVTVTLTADPCANPVTLTETSAPPGSTYSWSGPGVVNVNSASTTANAPQGMQTFSVTVTSAGLCPTTQSIDVNVNNNVTVDFTQSEACTDNVTLTATTAPPGSYTYRWYRNGVAIVGGGGQTIQATLADNGIDYRVEVVNTISGCVVTSATKTVNVFGSIAVVMDPVKPCQGDIFSIDALIEPATLTGVTYRWFFDDYDKHIDEIVIAGQTGATLTGLTKEGVYSVIAITSTGCESEKISGEIHFADSPEGNLPAKRYICNRPGNRDCSNPEPNTCVFQLTAGDGISWQWFKDGTMLSGQTTQTLTITEPGLYSVVIVNSFECETTDQTLVVEQCAPLIEVPNAFRPGSGVEINKTFSVFPTFVSEKGFQVFIYNRWGEMVYQSADRDFKWNGTYKGNGTLLPGGTYTYVMKFFGDLTTEGEQELRGSVM